MEEPLKFRLLEAEEIECRIDIVRKDYITLLLYKDARCDMNILDETVGPMNWKRRHFEIKGNLHCEISIWDKEKEQWVGKSDCGVQSNYQKEKGEASDSFKRAGTNWGIGRELYTAPFIMVGSNDANINTNGQNCKCKDRFVVKKVTYDEKGHIDGLAIKNETKNCWAFVQIPTVTTEEQEAIESV